jgi:hypothetical protein
MLAKGQHDWSQSTKLALTPLDIIKHSAHIPLVVLCSLCILFAFEIDSPHCSP